MSSMKTANDYFSQRMYVEASAGPVGTGIQDTRNSYLYGGGSSTFNGGPGIVSNLGSGKVHNYGNFLFVPRQTIPPASGAATRAMVGRIGKMPVLMPTALGNGGNWSYG